MFADDLDLRMVEDGLLDGRIAAEDIPSDDNGDFLGELGKVEGFFQGGVPSADDDDFLPLIERPVADGAETDASSDVLFFPGDVHLVLDGSGRDDDRTGLKDPSVLGHDFLQVPVQDFPYAGEFRLDLEFFGMPEHL